MIISMPSGMSARVLNFVAALYGSLTVGYPSLYSTGKVYSSGVTLLGPVSLAPMAQQAMPT
jgi:hypothetical protein